MQIVYDAVFNTSSPFYKERNRSENVRLLGVPNNISYKSWTNIERTLSKNYYVSKGLNPFNHLFDINQLEIPTTLPPKE